MFTNFFDDGGRLECEFSCWNEDQYCGMSMLCVLSVLSNDYNFDKIFLVSIELNEICIKFIYEIYIHI